jgi:hypothetical protein
MSRIIKLTESDLNRIVKRVIVENESKRYSDAILLLLETFKEDCVCGFEVDYNDKTDIYLIKMIVGNRDLDNKFKTNIQIRNYLNKLKNMVNDHVYNYLPIHFFVDIRDTPRCKSSLSESKVDVLVDMIKEHENTIYNYFKIVGEDGEVYGVGGVEKGSKNEVYFIDEIFNLGFTPVKISQEEYESYDDGDEIRNF